MGSETGAAEGGVVGGTASMVVQDVDRRVGKYEWTIVVQMAIVR